MPLNCYIHTIGTVITDNNATINNSSDIASAFNNYFAHVVMSPLNIDSFFVTLTNFTEISNIISFLDLQLFTKYLRQTLDRHLTLVRQCPMKSMSSVCLYVCPSVTKFSEYWIISFSWYCKWWLLSMTSND